MSRLKKIEEYCLTSKLSGSIFVKKDDFQYEQGFGFANRSEELFNTPETRFGMASGCKVFTAVAVCQLVEQGLAAFESPVLELLEEDFPHFDPEITVHHLLTHTSGIPDYFDEEVMDDYEELWQARLVYTIESPRDFLPMFQNNEMKCRPGERFSYNNAGFILLGLIVEKLSGLSFSEYIEKHIFEKCGMKDSGYFRMDQLPSRTAYGYIDSDADWKTNIYSLPVTGGPDGGAFTTVKDLSAFWQCLLFGELLSEPTRTLLLHPHVQDEGDFYYGYGVWILKKEEEVHKYFVFGFDPGVRMHSSFNVKTNAQTHILSNREQSLYPIFSGIDQLFGG